MVLSPGIHHITAVASDPQKNLDFYGLLLGLEVLKITVNFDDPGTYHFYYGVNNGVPGSVLTFFPWPQGSPGTQGSGTISHIALAIPSGSLAYWEKRLRNLPVTKEILFDETHLLFSDPDGLKLSLVESSAFPNLTSLPTNDITDTNAILGFYGVTASVNSSTHTASLLTELFGWTEAKTENHRIRFTPSSSDAALGTVIDLIVDPKLPTSSLGTGIVHHIAMRAHDDEQHIQFQQAASNKGLHVTPIIDRNYFHSIYFRERSGILFEIATDNPGFLIDEATLGTSLKLPSQYEDQRRGIESRLPRIKLPNGNQLP